MQLGFERLRGEIAFLAEDCWADLGSMFSPSGMAIFSSGMAPYNTLSYGMVPMGGFLFPTPHSFLGPFISGVQWGLQLLAIHSPS